MKGIMPAVDEQDVAGGRAVEPALWGEGAPVHFDGRVPAWVKLLVMGVLAAVAVVFLDQRIAVWARAAHPLPDVAGNYGRGDVARELMWLEQWGQGVCATVVVSAVFLIDRAGRRRALSLAMVCLMTLLVTHLLKDICGRSRPFVVGTDGGWVWGGPAKGFTKGSSWGSFPSAHTTGAFALAAGLAWFYPRGRGLFMGLALVTAGQRVLHTAHYLSDTIAGLAIGTVVVRWTLMHRLPGRVIAVFPAKVRDWWLADW